MATEKRSLPSKVQAMRARKRRKLDGEGDVQPKSSQPKDKRPVIADELQWQAVDMPNRLDDYEGFFGLEELDGVDVIKDDQTGRVKFYSSEHASAVKTAEVSASSAPLNDQEADDWDGFEDPATRTALARTDDKQAKAAKAPISILKKPKKPKAADYTDEGLPKSISAFQALQKHAEDTDIDVSAWQSLKLSPSLNAALAQLAFSVPTSIQAQSIPLILDGHDVIGKASTGSGKTLAFGIPLIERYLERTSKQMNGDSTHLMALILSPTRELAHQLEKHLLALAEGLPESKPSIVCLTGGLSLQKQQRLLKGADIIIATPGRLWELASIEKAFAAALKQIQFLVIDEADRLLSEGHFKEVEEILNLLDRKDDEIDDEAGADVDHLPKSQKLSAGQRQTLVFSATFDKSLHTKLLGKGRAGGSSTSTKDSIAYLMSKLNFRDTPKFVDVNPIKQLATGLREGLLECGAMEKDLYLYSILLHHAKARVMVFTNSISAVRRLTPFLQNLDMPALALHSGMAQKARLRSVERLAEASAKNKGAVLVTTDVAARGLDIPDVELVVHYNLPRAADMYVHRSGRTARAGKSGSSIIICSPEEAAGVRKLVAKVHAQNATAQAMSGNKAAKQGYYIRTMDPDRKVVARLKPRVVLAKKLADITIAKEKQHKEDEFLQAAAEELGVDYDSDEFQKQAPGRSGRGSGRKLKEKQAQGVGKAEAASMKAELKQLLAVRVNAGVSEKYITTGKVDVDDLLAQQEQNRRNGEFLGSSSGFVLEDD